MSKILIVGKTPPPIGGVSIHVSRLLVFLKKNDIVFSFLKLNFLNFFLLNFIILKYEIIHLHTSNIHVMKWISILSRILRKKLIITFHGDINRYDGKDKQIVKNIMKRISIPILLNEGSFKIAKKINKRSRLVSAFIPPFEDKHLQNDLVNKIEDLKYYYNFVYATNAYSLTYDKFKKEIYGILDLIDYFKLNTNIALVISDPSSRYTEYLKLNRISLPKNILLINISHSFYEVLKLVDASIRNTSTDGDSLSVRESIFLNKMTLATNVVSRPAGTLTYSRGQYNFSSYESLINQFECKKKEIQQSNYKSILDIYKSL